MAYEDYENSVASGMPVELYHWYSEGEGHFRQTSGAEIITYGGHDWTPEYPLQRSPVRLMGGKDKDEIEIKTSRTNPAVTPYIAAPAEYPVYLILYRGHESTFVVYRTLELSGVSFRDSKYALIKAGPKSSKSQGVSRRRISSRLCNLPLYGPRCGVEQELFELTGTLDTVDGITLTSATFATKADGWLVPGKIIVGGKRRMIVSHVTNTITLVSALPGAEAGDNFKANAGCDHSAGECKNTFSNLDNMWADLYLPDNSLYSGQPLIHKGI